MVFVFKAFGHENIMGIHPNTFEFTKDSRLSKDGDCVVGVNADFSFEDIDKFVESKVSSGDLTITITIKVDSLVESAKAVINPKFSSHNELVFRKTHFFSDRTLGINCNKSCIDFSRVFIEKLKNPKTEIIVELK